MKIINQGTNLIVDSDPSVPIRGAPLGYRLHEDPQLLHARVSSYPHTYDRQPETVVSLHYRHRKNGHPLHPLFKFVLGAGGHRVHVVVLAVVLEDRVRAV